MNFPSSKTICTITNSFLDLVSVRKRKTKTKTNKHPSRVPSTLVSGADCFQFIKKTNPLMNYKIDCFLNTRLITVTILLFYRMLTHICSQYRSVSHEKGIKTSFTSLTSGAHSQLVSNSSKVFSQVRKKNRRMSSTNVVRYILRRSQTTYPSCQLLRPSTRPTNSFELPRNRTAKYYEIH